jgi:exonuclease VII small subunit
MKTITLQTILEAIQGLENGQKSLENGQKSLGNGQRVLEKGQKDLQSAQKDLQSGQKGLEKRLTEKIESEVGNLARITADHFNRVDGRFDIIESQMATAEYESDATRGDIHNIQISVNKLSERLTHHTEHEMTLRYKITDRVEILEKDMKIMKRKLVVSR